MSPSFSPKVEILYTEVETLNNKLSLKSLESMNEETLSQDLN